MYPLKVLWCLLFTCHISDGRRTEGHTANAAVAPHRGVQKAKEPPYVSVSSFELFIDGEDTCTLDPLQLHTFTSCGFNGSNPLIIITHGWSMDGVMESWVHRLATALRTHLNDANIVITDWLPLAHQLYPMAVKSTRTVGKDIAHLLQTLKEHYQYPPGKAHLIGYSLGAHISGFAGSFLKGPDKIGRITGLDPAGPLFEGMSPTDRLSPDDAVFVDAIHTFTHERMGFSVGINQPVAHYDFYPNGGDFQPGCHLHDVFDHITEYGIHGFEQTVKCAHERSVHLFIDSLLHKDQQSTAYRCRDASAFDRGVCLDCRKKRCNTLGYNIKQVPTRRSKSLYLKTRPRMPYKLYHYQVRIQLVNQMESSTKLSLTIALTGTKDDSGELSITFPEQTSGNRTHTFLITLDRDLGELMLLTVHWDGPALWKHIWKWMQTAIRWGGRESKPLLTVGKVSVKAGETQQRTSFCAMTNDGQQVEMSQDKVFVRCEENTHTLEHRKNQPRPTAGGKDLSRLTDDV